jgi:hypothetical protein
MTRSLSLALGLGFVIAACSSSKTPPATATPKGEESAKVIVEDSSETWYEETSGKPGESGTGIREYVLDVTKRVEWKGGGGTLLDAGAPPPDRIFRIAVRFPVPKVFPEAARDPHVVNRLLWDVRKEIAKCWYKGGGKEPGAETTMIGWMNVSKEGKITASGVERADEPIAKTGAGECIMENVKDMAFSAAGDDTKVRFKLKLQTMDVTGKADAKVAPASSAK